MIHLSPEVAAAAASAADWRGMSVEVYVDKAITRAARLDAELAASLREADDAIAAGRIHTQEEVEAMFGVVRERRDAA